MSPPFDIYRNRCAVATQRLFVVFFSRLVIDLIHLFTRRLFIFFFCSYVLLDNVPFHHVMTCNFFRFQNKNWTRWRREFRLKRVRKHFKYHSDWTYIVLNAIYIKWNAKANIVNCVWFSLRLLPFFSIWAPVYKQVNDAYIPIFIRDLMTDFYL